MQQDLAGLAFAAGLVAALNPCGFAMLPAYLALVVRDSRTEERSGAATRGGSRALAATAAMTLGFLAVFGTFGLLTVSLASTVQRYMPYVTVLIGIVLVALGIWLLAGVSLRCLLPNRLARSASWAPTRRLGSMFGYGVGYAIASLSCTVGPFLAVTGAGVGGTSAAAGLDLRWHMPAASRWSSARWPSRSHWRARHSSNGCGESCPTSTESAGRC